MSESVKNTEEWHKIGNKLTSFFGICPCQRKLKTIVDDLYKIYTICLGAYEGTHQRSAFTGSDWLIIAMLDRYSDAISHGTNCEYPIINKDAELWKFILEVKDSSYLEDN